MKNLTVCMYGAASDKIDDIYKEEVKELGKQLALNEYKLIFGGGATGLMGAVSKGALENGGYVIGVVPGFISEFEPTENNCTTVIKTRNMSVRKQVMEENADVFIVVPGGVGTLDEFFQILTLVELRQKDSPIIMLNINHFYDDMIKFLDDCISKGFAWEGIRELFYSTEDVDSVIEIIDKYYENSGLFK